MNHTARLLILIVTLTSWYVDAYAQSPPEVLLQQMAEQLLLTPDDDALRGKIIKLSTEISPAPPVPEQAREPFVMATTMLQKASDTAGVGKAIEYYTRAITIAPWFADAYYNRAVANETAGNLDAAIADLGFYLGFNLAGDERRSAQDKMYALKADIEIAGAQRAEQARQAAVEREALRAEEAKYGWILGAWIWDKLDFSGAITESVPFQMVRDGDAIMAIAPGPGLRGLVSANGAITWGLLSAVADCGYAGTYLPAGNMRFTRDNRSATFQYPIPEIPGCKITYNEYASTRIRRP